MAVNTAVPNTRARLTLGVLSSGHMANDFYQIVIPFLIPDLTAAFELSYWAAGGIFLASSLVPALSQAVLGYLGDRFSIRKQVLASGFILYAAGLFILADAAQFPRVLAAVLIFGMGTATFHPQSTNLIARTFTKAKGRALGVHGVGGAIGTFLTPIISAALLAAFSFNIALRWLALPAILMALIIWLLLREPKPSGRKVQIKVPGGIWALSLTFGLLFMTYSGLLAFLPLFLVESGATLLQAGVTSTGILVVGFVSQPLGGLAYDRLGGAKVFVICSAAAAVGCVMTPLGLLHPMIGITLAMAAIFATFPVTLAMASDYTDGEPGFQIGFVFGVSGVLGAFAPAITGRLADALSLAQAFQLLAVFAAAGAVVAWVWLRKPDPRGLTVAD
jgi:FSR family fosmidomycin resistance protein-like MFS transporter